MQTKTIIKKDNHEVMVSKCCVFINGKLKNFCIVESGQYFVNEKQANRAANDLLLKKSLPKYRYAERQIEKRKRTGANKIAIIHDCYLDSIAYIKRWEGILYLETKKRLLNELKSKLDTACNKYGFKNAHAAIGFIKYLKTIKNKIK